MTIFNLGSINADHVYDVPHLPGPGETLAANSVRIGLGGKGANMSVAAARAGSHVAHIGAIGKDGAWARDRLMEYGVDTRHIAEVQDQTGHAIINVDGCGENAIVIYPGANREIALNRVRDVLKAGKPGDIVVTQNETNGQSHFLKNGSNMGFRACYAAAPFDVDAVKAVLPFIDLLILNEVEAQQLTNALGMDPDGLGVEDVIITLGARGSRWIGSSGIVETPAIEVDAVDTTGAGDTFTGYVLAGLDRGLPMAQAIQRATKASAIMVTRMGTADVIPDLKDVEDFTFA